MTENNDKANILYVDDEPDNLTVFRLAMRRYFNVLTADSASKGFEILEKHNIQVIVTDQRMPDMTGVEFLSKIPEEPRITRIILTAFTEAEALIEAVNRGHIFRYISKPWKLEDLRQTIESAYQHQQLYTRNSKLLLDLQDSNLQLAAANESLHKSNKDLYNLDIAKSEFLNIISHEIKTPLNGIIGLTRLLSAQIDDKQYRNHFDALKLSIDRLDEFGQNAIFITELQMQKYNISQQQHVFGELLKSASSQLKHKLKVKRVAINTSEDSKNLILNTDGLLLKKCLTVLLDNAIRYSPELKAEILIAATSKDDLIRISITDQGDGFSEQAMDRLFEYFGVGQMHYDKQVGLGLSLVKLAMTRLSGNVYVKNISPTGACVTIEFPNNSSAIAY